MESPTLYKMGPVTDTGAPYQFRKQSEISSQFHLDVPIILVMTSSSQPNPKRRIKISSTRVVMRPLVHTEIPRTTIQAKEQDHSSWLKLAESSFDFWDNDEDAAYDRL